MRLHKGICCLDAGSMRFMQSSFTASLSIQCSGEEHLLEPWQGRVQILLHVVWLGISAAHNSIKKPLDLTSHTCLPSCCVRHGWPADVWALGAQSWQGLPVKMEQCGRASLAKLAHAASDAIKHVQMHSQQSTLEHARACCMHFV